MYYPSSENKGTDQLCSYCTADLRLCFGIDKKQFSHHGTHFIDVHGEHMATYVLKQEKQVFNI